MKNIRVFLSEKKIQFLEMKFPIYLNRRVLVMYFLMLRLSSRHFFPTVSRTVTSEVLLSATFACIRLNMK